MPDQINIINQTQIINPDIPCTLFMTYCHENTLYKSYINWDVNSDGSILVYMDIDNTNKFNGLRNEFRKLTAKLNKEDALFFLEIVNQIDDEGKFLKLVFFLSEFQEININNY